MRMSGTRGLDHRSFLSRVAFKQVLFSSESTRLNSGGHRCPPRPSGVQPPEEPGPVHDNPLDSRTPWPSDHCATHDRQTGRRGENQAPSYLVVPDPCKRQAVVGCGSFFRSPHLFAPVPFPHLTFRLLLGAEVSIAIALERRPIPRMPFRR